MDNNQNYIQNFNNNVISDNGNKRNNSNTRVLIIISFIVLIGIIIFLVYDNYIKDKDEPKPTPTSSQKENDPIEYTNDYVEKTKANTFKETGLSIITGVKQQLIIANKLEEADYYFSSSTLENGGKYSTLGGEIKYQDISNCNDRIGNYICKSQTKLLCYDEAPSFVRVTNNNGSYIYSICLTVGKGNKYIDNGLERELLDYNNFSMIK